MTRTSAQQHNEIQRFTVTRADNGILIATDVESGERFTVSQWYESNVISDEFLSHVRYEGSRIAFIDRKDVDEYLTPVVQETKKMTRLTTALFAAEVESLGYYLVINKSGTRQHHKYEVFRDGNRFFAGANNLLTCQENFRERHANLVAERNEQEINAYKAQVARNDQLFKECYSAGIEPRLGAETLVEDEEAMGRQLVENADVIKIDRQILRDNLAELAAEGEVLAWERAAARYNQERETVNSILSVPSGVGFGDTRYLKNATPRRIARRAARFNALIA